MDKDRKGESSANTSVYIAEPNKSARVACQDRKCVEIFPEQYPLLLGASKLRPRRLFYKGTLPAQDAIGIAMVGTRRPSDSAPELCRKLVQSLRGTKAVVVSGLAQGIDSYCHEAALDAGIPTIAVIAQGIEARIPGARAYLARRILESGGAILSEYEGDAASLKGMFPARNRIISGLCRATVLVQSKTKGGALITADYCLSEGKPLFAIPGNFDSDVASGPNFYLDNGKAKPVFIPESLREIVGIPLIANEGKFISLKDFMAQGCSLSKDASAIFKKFNGFRVTFSEIQDSCNFKTANILAILTELEIAGLVKTKDNMQFYFNGSP
ncbi:MAG: DNA-protecting protein DprA [Fibrobacter sp.]|nr:DNA-protecting protein DprA [Fibrobacter sp.]